MQNIVQNSIQKIVNRSILALALLIGAGTLATHARQGQNPDETEHAPISSASVAVVDMNRVYEASDKPVQMQRKATETGRDLNNQMLQISTVSYLDQQELSDYIKAITAADPSAAQKDQATNLRALSDRRAQELDLLRIKKDTDLTAADKRRIQELRDLSQSNQKFLPTIENLLRADRNVKLEAFRREQMNELRGVVGKVAARKFIVWDSSCLVYCPNDITAEVIKKVKH